MEGQENIVEKYAVYVDKNGADSLAIVVDTQEQAKAEMEKLKSTTTYAHISKAKVSNFGKPDEKTVESNIIDTWNAPNATGAGKLSDAQNNGAQGNGQVIPPITPAPIVPEVKKDLWDEYYIKSGSLIGLGYAFEGVKIAEAAPAVVAPVLDNGGEAKSKEVLDKMTSDINAKLSLVKLMQEKKIEGFGVIQENGKFFIEVAVEKKGEELEKEIPKQIDGIEVKVIERPKTVAQPEIKEPIKEQVK